MKILLKLYLWLLDWNYIWRMNMNIILNILAAPLILIVLILNRVDSALWWKSYWSNALRSLMGYSTYQTIPISNQDSFPSSWQCSPWSLQRMWSWGKLLFVRSNWKLGLAITFFLAKWYIRILLAVLTLVMLKWIFP